MLIIAEWSSKLPAKRKDDVRTHRIALARDIAALFESGVGPARFRAIWREQQKLAARKQQATRR